MAPNRGQFPSCDLVELSAANETDLRALSGLRRREALALLRGDFPAGAYYLIGYAVECALKGCIARSTLKHDFPEKTRVRRIWVIAVFEPIAQQLRRFVKTRADGMSDIAIGSSMVGDLMVEGAHVYRST